MAACVFIAYFVSSLTLSLSLSRIKATSARHTTHLLQRIVPLERVRDARLAGLARFRIEGGRHAGAVGEDLEEQFVDGEPEDLDEDEDGADDHETKVDLHVCFLVPLFRLEGVRFRDLLHERGRF